MLTESQVIDAVCRHLRRKGWRIVSRCNKSERGDDVVAEYKADGRLALIEAKGETSSKKHTNRFGMAFNSRQVSSHVSRAFFRAAQTVGSRTRGAIALRPRMCGRHCCMSRAAPIRLVSICLRPSAIGTSSSAPYCP